MMSVESGEGDDGAYVMPVYVKLLCSDAARSCRFYEALGFERRQQDQVFTHLRWARHADLFLVTAPAGVPFVAPRGAGVIICFSVVDGGGVDAVVARAHAAGATVDGPRVQPWHTRELVVSDPDGYRICFVEPA